MHTLEQVYHPAQPTTAPQNADIRPYLLESWEFLDLGECLYVRGYPVGHPLKPSDQAVMIGPVLGADETGVTTRYGVWVLGSPKELAAACGALEGTRATSRVVRA